MRTGLLLATLMFLGCGGEKGPEIATVTGKITMDGQPLPNATITFVPANGRPSYGMTNDAGEYTLEFSEGRNGAMPGPNTVRISTARFATEDDDGVEVPGVPESVPVKYNAQSELKYDVKAGEANVADFDIESSGRIIDNSQVND